MIFENIIFLIHGQQIHEKGCDQYWTPFLKMDSCNKINVYQEGIFSDRIPP